MKKIIYTLIIIILVIVIVFAIRFLIGGSEDTWICDDGEWVKHGVPSAPMPDKACPGAGDKVIITNFDECIQAGNPAMESYPRRCRTEDNNEFIEDIGNELEKQDLIQIDSPFLYTSDLAYIPLYILKNLAHCNECYNASHADEEYFTLFGVFVHQSFFFDFAEIRTHPRTKVPASAKSFCL